MASAALSKTPNVRTNTHKTTVFSTFSINMNQSSSGEETESVSVDTSNLDDDEIDSVSTYTSNLDDDEIDSVSTDTSHVYGDEIDSVSTDTSYLAAAEIDSGTNRFVEECPVPARVTFQSSRETPERGTMSSSLYNSTSYEPVSKGRVMLCNLVPPCVCFALVMSVTMTGIAAIAMACAGY
jgi:hypothetical protein